MKARAKRSRLRIVPRDVLLYEDVEIGDVQALDVSTHLNMEVTIAIDRPEIDKISKIPEVADAIAKQIPPDVKKYGTTEKNAGDWRAKVPEIRKAQWKFKPVIEYIIKAYEEFVLGAAVQKFAGMPDDWKKAMFGGEGENVEYQKDPKALQLSTHSKSDIDTATDQGKTMWPDNTGKWRFIYVNVSINLGDLDESLEGGTGFFGKLNQEFRAAVTAGRVGKIDDKTMQIQTTLTGFDSVLRDLDPYSGKKSSDAKIGIYNIADEPGYDLEIRIGFIERISEMISYALDNRITNLKVDDNGVFTFNAAAYQRDYSSDQEEIASEMEPGMEPEAEEELPPEEPEAPEAGEQPEA